MENEASNDDTWADLVRLWTGPFFFGGLGVFGYQIYVYLKQGAWKSISIVTLLEWFKVEWAGNPSNWFGVYRILDAIPLSLTLFALAFISIQCARLFR
jgi:hypothetical protein